MDGSCRHRARATRQSGRHRPAMLQPRPLATSANDAGAGFRVQRKASCASTSTPTFSIGGSYAAYGYVCAAVTYLGGIGIHELAASEGKEILFHKSPWLGISFVGLVLFVIVFTNVRARGVYSFVLILIAAGIVWGARYIPGIGAAMNWAGLLRIHFNLAFYVAFSSALTLIWLFVVVFVDHFSWWRFSPGQVIEEHRVGQATGHAFNTEGMVVRRLPDDFFRHRILGLGLIGLGTGDFIVKPPYEELLRDPQRVEGQQQAEADGNDDRTAHGGVGQAGLSAVGGY